MLRQLDLQSHVLPGRLVHDSFCSAGLRTEVTKLDFFKECKVKKLLLLL